MADEKLVVSDPSPDAGLLTGADVDFESYSAERRVERTGKPVAEPAKEPEPEPKQAETASADKAEAQVTEPADKANPVPSLTREEVQREIDARLAAQPKTEVKKEEPKEDVFPTLSDPQFKTVEECEAAQAEWVKRHTAAEIAKAFDKRDADTKAAREQETEWEGKKRAWEERVTEAKGRHADWDQVFEIGKTRPPNEVALQFIVDSKVGPDLFVHYVRNEQDWSELIALKPDDIRLEMRLVEREIKRNVASTPAAPKAKTISDAPPPARMLNGKASPADDQKERAAAEGDVDSYHRIRMAERERDTAGRFR